MSVETGNFPDDNSKFAKEFEEYRRACREKYQQNQPPQTIPEELDEESDDEVDVDSDLEEEVVEVKKVQASSSPVITDSRLSSSASIAVGSSPLSASSNNVRLNSSVDTIKSESSTERRNSFSKMFSFCSNVFKKTSGSPTMEREKEKSKMERKKAEQDFRMARFIAELEMEGRSDEEIQTHLFHIRDQAQFARPRSNSVSEWFREMHQAFKDEFSLRNSRECVTIHVSTVNPFAAAVPTNYMHDMGYSYEDLVALEPVPRGIKSLDHLPTTVYEGQELPSNQTTCAVCMADFETSEELRSLHCTHHFHKECIDKWLGVATTCPVCKGEVCNE